MSKTITLKLDENLYNKFRQIATSQNRSLANFIETSMIRFIEQNQLVDDYEMDEIRCNEELNTSLKRAIEDAKNRKGQFVE